MVKVNLMDTPEEGATPKKKEPEATHTEPIKTEMDFSFLQPEETTVPGGVTMPPPAPETSAGVGSAEDVLFEPQGKISDTGEETFSFESNSKKRLFIILGVVLVVLLAALFVILWMGPGDEPAPTADVPAPTTAPPASTTPPPNKIGSAIPPALQRTYAQNKSENLFNLNYAQTFLGFQQPSAGVSLIVIAPGAAYVSVVADTRDDIAEFRRAIKDEIPSIQLKVESISPKLVDNQRKLVADFYVPLPATVASQPAAGNVKVLKEHNILSELRNLAQTHRLQINTLRQGQKRRTKGLVVTPCYMHVSGNNTSILKFLSQLTQKYPAVKFTKISIFPSGAEVIGKGRLNARIEMNVTTPTAN